PNLAGTDSGFAFGLSPGGRVAGGSQSAATGAILPIVWTSGTPSSFTRPTGYSGFATAVNDTGTAAGVIFNYAFPNLPTNPIAHAPVFKDANSLDIHAPLPVSGSNSVATGINSSGWIVGTSGDSTLAAAFQFISQLPISAANQAFLYVNGQAY